MREAAYGVAKEKEHLWTKKLDHDLIWTSTFDREKSSLFKVRFLTDRDSVVR